MASAVQKRMRENMEFLRELAKQQDDKDSKQRLNEIAEDLANVADVMFTPSLILERRTEEALTELVDDWLKNGEQMSADRDEHLALVAAIWWHARSTRTSASRNVIAGGLGAIANSLFSAPNPREVTVTSGNGRKRK